MQNMKLKWKGKVGVISTREVAQVCGFMDAPAPSVAKPGLRDKYRCMHMQNAAVNTGSGCKACPVGTNGGEIVKLPCRNHTRCEGQYWRYGKRGQVMLILEAMKMENEIVAPADGTIIQIRAARGTSVNAGDVLAILQ